MNEVKGMRERRRKMDRGHSWKNKNKEKERGKKTTFDTQVKPSAIFIAPCRRGEHEYI